MRSTASWAETASGCTKIVRRVAATICWASLGTVASALRMKWTRQRCQVAPTRTSATACLRPRWASEVTSRTPFRPRSTSWRRNERQSSRSSAGPTSTPTTSRSPVRLIATAINTALEVNRADPGVPFPLPVPVAVGRPGLRAFVEPSPNQLRDLSVHKLLGKQPHAIAQEVGIGALLVLVEQVQQCHPEIGHRRGPPSGELKQLHLEPHGGRLGQAATDLHHDLRLN